MAALSLAQTKTWSGAASSDWNTAGNWSPNGVPRETDSVQFDGSPTVLCTLQSDVVCGALIIGGSGLNTHGGANHALTCASLNMYAGEFSPNKSTVTIGGDFVVTGGTASHHQAGCRVVLAGDGVLDIGSDYHYRASHLTQNNGVQTYFQGNRVRMDTLVTGDETGCLGGCLGSDHSNLLFFSRLV